MSKILSIVIPCYNKWNFTKACLNDLSKLPSDHEIIIIDNGSSDETKNNLQDSQEIVYYRNEKNLGFAKACNIGYSISNGYNVLFLNNDIRVQTGHSIWTQKLLEYCDTSLVGPTMGQLDENLNFIQEANRDLSGKSYMSGWCLASSKKIWNKLDLGRDPVINDEYYGRPQIFSEEFGLAYFEDTDLSFRAKELKIPFKVVEMPVIHFGQQTSKQLNTKQLYQNAREIFVKKWKDR